MGVGEVEAGGVPLVLGLDPMEGVEVGVAEAVGEALVLGEAVGVPLVVAGVLGEAVLLEEFVARQSEPAVHTTQLSARTR